VGTWREVEVEIVVYGFARGGEEEVAEAWYSRNYRRGIAYSI